MSHIHITASLNPPQHGKVMGLWLQFPGLIPTSLATTSNSLRVHSKACWRWWKDTARFLIKSKSLCPLPMEWEVVMPPSSHLLFEHIRLVHCSTMLPLNKAVCGSMAQGDSCILGMTLLCWCSVILSLSKKEGCSAWGPGCTTVTLMSLLALLELLEYLYCML